MHTFKGGLLAVIIYVCMLLCKTIFHIVRGLFTCIGMFFVSELDINIFNRVLQLSACVLLCVRSFVLGFAQCWSLTGLSVFSYIAFLSGMHTIWQTFSVPHI